MTQAQHDRFMELIARLKRNTDDHRRNVETCESIMMDGYDLMLGLKDQTEVTEIRAVLQAHFDLICAKQTEH